MTAHTPSGVHRLQDMIGTADVAAGLPDGRYVRAVPEPFYWGLAGRLRAAWEVIAGRAHAVIWPCAGELEEAIGRKIAARAALSKAQEG